MTRDDGHRDAVDEGRLVEGLRAAIADANPTLEGRMTEDPEAYLDLVAVAAAAEAKTSELLRSAVVSARSAGHSWEAIGALLGITRQAAQQRFGREVGAGAEAPGTAQTGSSSASAASAPVAGDTRVVSGLTAFNEMRLLDRIGPYGWHSIGYGAFHHVVSKSDKQFEHLRLFGSLDVARALAAQGWERIGETWFPWIYLKRQLDLPALPEPRGLGSVLDVR